jgi:hypothetical protein
MSYYRTLLSASERSAAKRRDKERAQERAAKRDALALSFDKSEIEIDVLEFDESEVFALSESLTRYEIAH